MSTEVKHGPDPQWEATITPGEFSCEVVGHYTDHPTRAAAGVTAYTFNSARDEKRHAELLVLRTAFLDWFLVTYQALGGTKDEAIDEVEEYLIRVTEAGAADSEG